MGGGCRSSGPGCALATAPVSWRCPSYELFSSTEVLGRMTLERMLAGLSTWRYPVGLEPVGARNEQAAMSTSRSAVSRRFVAATETALVELLAADLSGLDLVALMIDGVHFGEHTCVVALGIGIDGTKHPLSLVEGSTENATLVRDLLVGLRERGLDVTRPILAAIDGAQALRRAVADVFDYPVIKRCQLHKIRNVRDRLPDKLRRVVERRMRDAYHAESTLAAQAQLETLANELERTHPGAAASLRGGLDETLTVLRLDVPPTLARTLRSTNAIEPMISICRDHSANVKLWRDGQMALRWCGMDRGGGRPRTVNLGGEHGEPARGAQVAELDRSVQGEDLVGALARGPRDLGRVVRAEGRLPRSPRLPPRRPTPRPARRQVPVDEPGTPSGLEPGQCCRAPTPSPAIPSAVTSVTVSRCGHQSRQARRRRRPHEAARRHGAPDPGPSPPPLGSASQTRGPACGSTARSSRQAGHGSVRYGM